jgi:phage protein U
MMMIYGMFVFELKTLPYQQLRHSLNWRHVKNDRINRSAKWQYIGAGRRRSTLTGCFTLKLRAATYLLPFWQRRHTPGVRGL